MLRHHRRRLTLKTPADPEAIQHLDQLGAWRALPRDVQKLRIGSDDTPFSPRREPGRGRIRLGLWCPCLGLGGAEIWQLALARAVDPAQVAWTGAAVFEGRAATHPMMLRQLAATMPVGHGPIAARAIAEVSDVVVTWAVTDVEGHLAGIENRPKVVMACHFPGESPWGPGTEELLRGVDRFVGVSELAVESTPRSIRDRVSVIWNAIDPDRLVIRRERATIFAGWGVPSNARVVGFLGRLSPEKDPGAMLRLAAELPEPWHVVIVGDGREREALCDAIAASHLDRVHMIAGDDSVGDVLNAFDTLVVPSRYESFGLSLAEGLWAGLPVIATRSGLARLVPGLVREIRIGASGAVIRNALLADSHDSVRTLERVTRAQAFVREHLTLDRFGRKWTDLIVALARQGRGGCS